MAPELIKAGAWLKGDKIICRRKKTVIPVGPRSSAAW
jgi:hypothetical protein